MKAIAIIVAAGSGTRFGAKKQFIEVAGKPLYYYSIKAFRPYVDHIILVVPEEDVNTVEPYGAIVIAGGKNRYNSVYNAIQTIDTIDTIDTINTINTINTIDTIGIIGTANSSDVHKSDDNTIVMIHDGARPCITQEVIKRVMKDTAQYGAAVATVPVTDTIRTIDGALIDRSKLRAMQTPQAFKYGLLKQSFDKLMALPQEAIDSLHITDDVQVVDQMAGVSAHMSDGDPGNIKVTQSGDVERLRFEQ